MLVIECCYTQFPESRRSYGELQSHLNNAAANLNEATSDVVVSSRGTPQQLATSSKRFSTAYTDLISSGMEMAGQTKVCYFIKWSLAF